MERSQKRKEALENLKRLDTEYPPVKKLIEDGGNILTPEEVAEREKKNE